MLRQITGIGRGFYIAFSDSVGGSQWTGFLDGADRIMMDNHRKLFIPCLLVVSISLTQMLRLPILLDQPTSSSVPLRAILWRILPAQRYVAIKAIVCRTVPLRLISLCLFLNRSAMDTLVNSSLQRPTLVSSSLGSGVLPVSSLHLSSVHALLVLLRQLRC